MQSSYEQVHDTKNGCRGTVPGNGVFGLLHIFDRFIVNFTVTLQQLYANL